MSIIRETPAGKAVESLTTQLQIGKVLQVMKMPIMKVMFGGIRSIKSFCWLSTFSSSAYEVYLQRL